MMTIKFKDSSLAELAKNKTVSGKQQFPDEVVKAFKKRVFQMKNAKSTQDLRNNKSLHYEKLKESRYEGKCSIRLNKAYRIIFGVDTQGSIEVLLIEEISNHYS